MTGSTRATRQSARVKAQASRKAPPKPVTRPSKPKKWQQPEPSHDGSDSEDEDESEKEEREASKKGKGKAIAKQPPKKRAKTTNNSRRKNVDFTGKLSSLPARPFDILLEIWRHLPLESLFALLQVNRLFRNALLSKECLSVWTSLRKAREAPEPLFGLTEQQWARLLFIDVCQRCGKARKGAVYHVFQFAKRLCFACIKAICINKRTYQSKYRGRHVDILDLILPFRDDPHDWYPVYEIENVLAALDACKDNKARNLYIKERKQYLEEIKKQIKICKQWKSKDSSRDMRSTRDGREDRRAQIKEKVLGLGYTEGDWERSGISHLPSAIASNVLTPKGWEMIKGSVIYCLEGSRVCRAFAPNADSVLLSRREMLSGTYDKYKKTLTPLDCRDLPNVPTVMLLYSAIQSLFTVPDSNSIDQQNVDEAFAETLPDITSLFADVRTTLTKQLKQRSVTVWRDGLLRDGRGNEAEESVGFVGPVPPAQEESLDLAIASVHCSQCYKTFPSMRTALHHLHCPFCCFTSHVFENRFCYKHSDEDITLGVSDGTRPVISMLEAAGMSVNTTTADQMDEKGDTFSCLRCEKKGSTFVGTWRECIKHYFKPRNHFNVHPPGSDPPPSPEEPLFKLVDNGGHEDKRKCWTCARCFTHLEGENVTRADVVVHLSSEHDVSNPTVPADFFYNGHECDEKPNLMRNLGRDPFQKYNSHTSEINFGNYDSDWDSDEDPPEGMMDWTGAFDPGTFSWDSEFSDDSSI